MSADDLIRRGDFEAELNAQRGHGWDAVPAVHPYDKGYLAAIDAAKLRLAALPAVAAPGVRVKRYDLEQPDSHMGSARMAEDEYGDWVRYDDIAALDTPAPALMAELVEAARPFAEYMDGGMDLDNNGEPLPDNEGVGWVYLTQGEFRRLRAVLAKLDAKP